LRSLIKTIRISHVARSATIVADMSLRSGLIFGVLSPLVLLAAPSADAAPGWLSPVSVSASEEGHQVGELRVAFDKQGDAVAV
jgi:hypothetical protein